MLLGTTIVFYMLDLAGTFVGQVGYLLMKQVLLEKEKA